MPNFTSSITALSGSDPVADPRGSERGVIPCPDWLLRDPEKIGIAGPMVADRRRFRHAGIDRRKLR